MIPHSDSVKGEVKGNEPSLLIQAPNRGFGETKLNRLGINVWERGGNGDRGPQGIFL